MSDDVTRLIDMAGSVDVGSGFRLAWSVGADGDRWPMLADDRQTEPMTIPHEPRHFRSVARHELSGRMPDEFQQFRCAGSTSAGRACRTVVAEPGLRCIHHPAQLEEEPVETATVPTRPPRPSRRRRRAVVSDDQLALFTLDEQSGRP